jgi:hypothetical protein
MKTLLLFAALVTAPPVPAVTGPVTMPGTMYPDPPVSVVPAAVKVEDFPYVTEEFFVSGRAAGAPYTTRIIIRRPSDAKSFSGTVVAEAMHAGGRSLIFEWSRVSILTRRHVFAEIVHSPAQIQMLKTFNAQRYAPLSIAMGQSNEIIAQFGRLMKDPGLGGSDRLLKGYRVRRVTLMGTSASSATVRNYLGVHGELRMPDGAPIFDGFLLTSTLGNTPLPGVDVPMIQMPTQTEVAMYAAQGNGYRRADSDAPDNRFRLYEVAGMPHNNSRDNPAFLNDPCTLPVTDFPAGAFTALGLNYLIGWIEKGKAPPHAPPITVENGAIAVDEYGNAKGGVRNVFVDVPVATHGVLAKGKTPQQDRLCQLGGTKVLLPQETLAKLYKSSDGYQKRVNARLKELVKEGWYLPEYVEDARRDAVKVRIQ